jgi:hypothetical protein
VNATASLLVDAAVDLLRLAVDLTEEGSVERVVSVRLPTRFGEFTALGYRTSLCEREYVVFVRGELGALGPANVHLHSGCLRGDVFRSRACPCGSRLERAMESVAAEGGAIVYLPRLDDCAELAAAAGRSRVDRRVADLILRDLGVVGAER